MKIIAGFDIGGTNARLMLFNEEYQVIAQAKERIRGRTKPEEIATLMTAMIGAQLPDNAELQAVGVGLAGQLDKTGEVVINAPNLTWHDVKFREILADSLEALGDTDKPSVRIVNDLNAVLWGEAVAGAAKGVEDVLAVYVGTGVGGAILSGGTLVAGHSGKAGEIGHAKVVVGGRLCGCGEHGCVEAYAGGVHLEAAFFALTHDAEDLEPLENMDEASLLAADKLSETNDAVDALWDRVTDYLAISIANAVTLLNPRVLLLGGCVLENLPNFRKRTLQKISPLILAASREDLEIRFGALGDKAGVLGAALLSQHIRK